LKKRYNFTCPNCLYEQSAAPSLFMEMGYNAGHGSCMNCDVFLHLEIVPDLDGHEMKATLWGDYLEKKNLTNWTIYKHPKDYPDKVVARKFILDKPTSEIIIGNTIEEVRSGIPKGLTRFLPDERDDSVIVETWL